MELEERMVVSARAPSGGVWGAARCAVRWPVLEESMVVLASPPGGGVCGAPREVAARSASTAASAFAAAVEAAAACALASAASLRNWAFCSAMAASGDTTCGGRVAGEGAGAGQAWENAWWSAWGVELVALCRLRRATRACVLASLDGRGRCMLVFRLGVEAPPDTVLKCDRDKLAAEGAALAGSVEGRDDSRAAMRLGAEGVEVGV